MLYFYTNTDAWKSLLEESVSVTQRLRGSADERYGELSLELGDVLLQAGLFSESIPHFQKGIAIARESPPLAIWPQIRLAEAFYQLGRLQEARQEAELAIASGTQLEPNDPQIEVYERALYSCAAICFKSGDVVRAEELLQQRINISAKRHGVQSRECMERKLELVWLCRAANRESEAAVTAVELAQALVELIAEDSSRFTDSDIGHTLAGELFQLGKISESEQLLTKALTAMQKQLGPGHVETEKVSFALAQVRASLHGQAGANPNRDVP